MTNSKLKIPYSYFGGKRRVAPIIWKAFGKVDNYVEPFFGSLSVLLENPTPAKIETVNEIDGFLVNFWRAIKNDYENVIKYADYPVTELDLHARHKWLLTKEVSFLLKKLENNADFYDSKIAGFWIYGQCASIGNNWLQNKGLKAMPLLSLAGGGIHGLDYNLKKDLQNLQARLKRVRICCGDWKRILTPAILHKNKSISNKNMTAIFLDPPYSMNNRNKIYKEESNIFQEVCQWAIDNNNPKLRIAVCGYENDFIFPATWSSYHWSSGGGLSSLGDNQGKINSHRETIWFNQYCNKV